MTIKVLAIFLAVLISPIPCVLGELAGKKAMEDLGYRSLPCKLKGNQGFDGVFVKYKEGSEEVVESIILESKFSSSGRVRLGKSGKGQQMGDVWIERTLGEMEATYNTDLVKTAKIIRDNSKLVKRRINVLDASGTNKWYNAEDYLKK